MRTNGKSYFHVSHGKFELRHKTNLNENRVTYRYPIKLNKKFILSLPLHYKIEKNEPTLEPRLIYQFPKYKIWIQKEFNIHHNYDMAIAVDIPYKNLTYRIGWDDSKTVRFRLMVKI